MLLKMERTRLKRAENAVKKMKDFTKNSGTRRRASTYFKRVNTGFFTKVVQGM